MHELEVLLACSFGPLLDEFRKHGMELVAWSRSEVAQNPALPATWLSVAEPPCPHSVDGVCAESRAGGAGTMEKDAGLDCLSKHLSVIGIGYRE